MAETLISACFPAVAKEALRRCFALSIGLIDISRDSSCSCCNCWALERDGAETFIVFPLSPVAKEASGPPTQGANFEIKSFRPPKQLSDESAKICTVSPLPAVENEALEAIEHEGSSLSAACSTCCALVIEASETMIRFSFPAIAKDTSGAPTGDEACEPFRSLSQEGIFEESS